MARYCFYCGRELQTGEKCNCRHHQQTRSADNSKQASDRQQTESSGKSSEKGSAGQTSANASSSTSDSRQASGTASSGYKKTAPKKDGKRAGQSFVLFWQQIKNYFSSSGRASKNKQTAYGHQTRQSTGRSSSHNAHSSRTYYRNTSQTGSKQSFTRAGARRRSNASLSEKARKIALYFIQPVDQMREIAAQRTAQPVLQLVFFHAFAFGMFFLLATDQQHLRMVLGLNVASAQQGNSLMVRLFLLIQGIGMGAAGYLLHVFIYQLLLRYVFRQAYAYRQLLTGLSGACFFSGVFILGGVFLLSGSFFSAFLMLLTGFAVTLLMQRIALHEISGLDENRLLMLTILAAMIFTSVIALFLNLSLPVLDILLEQSIVI